MWGSVHCQRAFSTRGAVNAAAQPYNCIHSHSHSLPVRPHSALPRGRILHILPPSAAGSADARRERITRLRMEDASFRGVCRAVEGPGGMTRSARQPREDAPPKFAPWQREREFKRSERITCERTSSFFLFLNSWQQPFCCGDAVWKLGRNCRLLAREHAFATGGRPICFVDMHFHPSRPAAVRTNKTKNGCERRPHHGQQMGGVPCGAHASCQARA